MKILWTLPVLELLNAFDIVHAARGSFSDPGPHQRPRFRYWIPDASVSTDVVASDIRSAGAVGAGGVELLGFYNYGGSFGPPPAGIDWTVTGWGLPAWKKLQDVAIQTTVETQMVIDLALGPNQGAGVPAPYNDTGRAWQLVASNISLPAGASYNGILPGWERGNFVAATIGQVVGNESITQISRNGFTEVNLLPGFQVTLAQESLDDITAQVSTDGNINLTLPASPAAATYVLFGFYENQPETYNTPPFNKTTVTNFVQNGSWIVDHFSSRGAQTVIDFWSQYLLDDSNTAQLREVGNYLWEDSQEWSYENGGVTVLWTPSLLAAFSESRGYDLQRYLPLIMNGNNGNVGALVSLTTFVTDEKDRGQRFINDFRQTLTELNANYLKSLSLWAEDLGMHFSAQPGYNLELDLLATVPNVAIPETESLGFNDLIDGYRQFTGPALLAGRNIISSELGAVMGDVYAQSIPDILFHIKRSLVSSINAFVIHGLAWSGTYPSCTYPSYTTFAYLFSEMHGPHLPAWEYYGDWMNYTARSQYILQSSIPKYDVAFWLKNVSYHSIVTGYTPHDLEDIGYTYQYLSPDNLQLPAAQVVNGVLGPDAQGFKAFVVRANDTLTAPGIDKLAEFAHAGLPIFFSGGLPSMQLGNDTAGQQYIDTTIKALSALSNVHVVPYDNLAVSLAQQGILPKVTIHMNGTVYSHWSQNSTSSDFIVLLNDAPGQTPDDSSVAGNVTFQTTGNPYSYNAWTGDITPLDVFQRSPDGKTITIPISLAGNQTVIIGFDKVGTPKSSKISSAQGIWSFSSDSDDSSIEALVVSDEASITLSNGSIVSISSNTVTPITLSAWTLVIESWTPPTGASLNDSAAASIRTNTTYNLKHLVPWNEIPNVNLTAVAGRGFYRSSFNWTTHSSTGAVIDLGYILHTAHVIVNGQRLPPLDVTKAQADIGPYLRDGINDLQIVVSTPLANSLIPVQNQLSCLVNLGTAILETTNGLVKDVIIRPYEVHALSI